MPYTDKDKAKVSQRERSRRYHAKQHVKRFGEGAGDMRGRHGNHARGPSSGRWNNGRMRTSHGYICIAVPEGHHLRQAHGYAYEHQLVAEEMLGRRLLFNEAVHHLNGNRTDNRWENLHVQSVSEHAALHVATSEARDKRTGRFKPGTRHPSDWPEDLRIRQIPEVAR